MKIETLVQKIAEAIAEFGINNITGSTVVFVSKTDPSDVEVFNSDFDTFTKGYTTMAGYLCRVEEDEWEVDMAGVRRFVQDECHFDFES